MTKPKSEYTLEPSAARSQHEEYKDSGVEWLGEIPSHWEKGKLKYLARLETGTTPPKSNRSNYEGGRVPWVKPDDLEGKQVISDSDEKLTKEGLEKARLIPAGSVLVCCIGSIGEVGIAGVDLTTNQQINAVIFDEKGGVDSDFGLYALMASKQEHQRRAESNVVSIISKSEQGNIYFPVPPLNEQRAIADYLDRETERIDALIEKKEQLIDLLEEKRTALISRVVTQGLDSDVEMQDSGVEWLGEIPAHWELIRLKYTSEIIAGDSPPASSYNDKGDGVPLVNGPDEYSENDYGRTQEIRWTTEPTKMAPKNSLLFCVRGATTGRLNIAHSDLCVGRGVAAIVADEVQDYLNYQLMVYRPYALGIADGTTYPSVTTGLLGRSVVARPPEDEQRQIAEYLDREMKRIDGLIGKVEEGIERLKEYRTALISAAVTGQIDARNKQL